MPYVVCYILLGYSCFLHYNSSLHYTRVYVGLYAVASGENRSATTLDGASKALRSIARSSQPPLPRGKTIWGFRSRLGLLRQFYKVKCIWYFIWHDLGVKRPVKVPSVCARYNVENRSRSKILAHVPKRVFLIIVAPYSRRIPYRVQAGGIVLSRKTSTALAGFTVSVHLQLVACVPLRAHCLLAAILGRSFAYASCSMYRTTISIYSKSY